MRVLRRFLLAIVVLPVVVLSASVAHACPGCKQALATAAGEQANMVNGYFWSIIFMLSMPFSLLGIFSGSMYLAVRKARKAQALLSPERASEPGQLPVEEVRQELASSSAAS